MSYIGLPASVDSLLSPLVQSATSVTLKSTAADGASAILAKLSTTAVWNNTGAKLLSIETNNVEQVYLGQPAAAGWWELRSQTPQMGLRNSAGTGFFCATATNYLYSNGTAYQAMDSAGIRPSADVTGSLGDSTHRWSSLWTPIVQNSSTTIAMYTSGDTDGVIVTNFGANVPAIGFGQTGVTNRYIFGASGQVAINSGSLRVRLDAADGWTPSVSGVGLGSAAFPWTALYAPTMSEASASMSFLSGRSNAAPAYIFNHTGNFGAASASAFELQQSGTRYFAIFPESSGATKVQYNDYTGAAVYSIEEHLDGTISYSGSGPPILQPATDLTGKVGASGNRWNEVWAQVHAGVHQDITAGGAVAITTYLGEMCVLTSNANITGITLSAGKPAQLFTLQMVQGNALHTWPATITNARLAGGTFTKTTTLLADDQITFRWNTASSTWDEVGRALALA